MGIAGPGGSVPDPVCSLFLGSRRSGAVTYLDGQHPYGEGSSQVDVGFEGVEDHRVAALGGRTRGEATARGTVGAHRRVSG